MKAIETCKTNNRLPVTAADYIPSIPRDDPAVCNATRNDEHAVSMDKHGPVMPKTYDNHPHATASDEEVAEYVKCTGSYVVTCVKDGETKIPFTPKKKPTG